MPIARRVDYHCEFRVQDGARWLSSHAKLFCNRTEEPVRLLGITWDISDRMQAMEALRESEMRYRRLIAVLRRRFWCMMAIGCCTATRPSFGLVGAESLTKWPVGPAIDFVSVDDRTLGRKNPRNACDGRACFGSRDTACQTRCAKRSPPTVFRHGDGIWARSISRRHHSPHGQRTSHGIAPFRSEQCG